MKKTLILEKRIGQTPLEAIQEWKSMHPEYATIPASYAGRLDPMASGKLLVLLGDECKRQTDYIGLDKEYETEVLLGVGSDTGDILGLVESGNEHSSSDEEIEAALASEVGTHTLPYPIYSSKTVRGKPLFLYALEGTLDAIEIPTHQETIHSIELLDQDRLSEVELATRIESLLALAPISDEPSKELGADFRIHAVRESWAEALTHHRTYEVLHLRVFCGSGTYMRSLAGRIGEHLGSKALALSIHRTKIGNF